MVSDRACGGLGRALSTDATQQAAGKHHPRPLLLRYGLELAGSRVYSQRPLQLA